MCIDFAFTALYLETFAEELPLDSMVDMIQRRHTSQAHDRFLKSSSQRSHFSLHNLHHTITVFASVVSKMILSSRGSVLTLDVFEPQQYRQILFHAIRMASLKQYNNPIIATKQIVQTNTKTLFSPLLPLSSSSIGVSGGVDFVLAQNFPKPAGNTLVKVLDATFSHFPQSL